ncbi:hypothetical protein P7C71_g3830, partial [Lecanoromycetidae sp. Uapishka_2]
MLMIAPLCDSRGKIRYFIGAQVDVSGLVKDCTDLESLQLLVTRERANHDDVYAKDNFDSHEEAKDDFQDLSEMLNVAELETVRKYGGRMHKEFQEEEGADNAHNGTPHMPRLLLQEPTTNDDPIYGPSTRQSGRLSGIYTNYLLIRPYPSFRILFASPSLRVPGILQSPFLDKIGGSARVREELSTALAEGRGVTAKVRWVAKVDEDGRNRWIHCTPLLGSNGSIGVWMVVLVDDDQELSRKWKQAPPVAPHRGRVYNGSSIEGQGMQSSVESVAGRGSGTGPAHQHHGTKRSGIANGSLRSTSPNSNVAIKLNTESVPRGVSWTVVNQEMYMNKSILSSSRYKESASLSYSVLAPQTGRPAAHFRPGDPKPSGSAYTRVVVIPRTKDENVSWIGDELPDINTVVYVANNPKEPLHPPRNKGREVMIYLTYIIDHYEALPDIMIFMHAHRYSHHNNDLLGYDAVQMIRRLSSDHVIREGYFNMRCHWRPGCPEWLHPHNKVESLERQEEEVLSRCWEELFPWEPLPKALGQPCCAQFALSKQRVHAIPLSHYVFYRDWMMRTPLSDYVSGRIWEYSWQFLFTGQSTLCPAEHICYCDGFGVCFGGAAEYKEFEDLRNIAKGFEDELQETASSKQNAIVEHSQGLVSLWTPLEPGRYSYLNSQVAALRQELAVRKQAALGRGLSPENRARECGRTWKEAGGL